MPKRKKKSLHLPISRHFLIGAAGVLLFAIVLAMAFPNASNRLLKTQLPEETTTN